MRPQSFALILLGLIFVSTNAMGQFDDEPAVSQPQTQTASLAITQEDLQRLKSALDSKDEDTVLAAASRILGKDSKHLLTLNALAVFYFETNKLGLAKIILNRAIADHPNVPALHNNLGIIYLREGNQRHAISAFRKSLELKSDYAVGATNLASIYLEYEDYSRALAPMEESYRVSKSALDKGEAFAVEIANNYALALTGMKEFKKAEKIYEQILASNSKNTDVLLNYAILQVERLNNPKAATSVISKIKFIADDRETLQRVEELEKKMKTLEQ